MSDGEDRAISSRLLSFGPVKTFKSFGPVSKWTLTCMFLSGWILLYALIKEDLSKSEWWHSLSYIPNIAAGLTGFLIGAPVALVLLASFTIEREERTALDRANRLTTFAWTQLRDEINDLCSESRFYGLRFDAASVYDGYRVVIQEFERYRISPHTDHDFDELQAHLRQQLPNWVDALNTVTQSVGTHKQIQLRWSAILANWSTLDQYVRLQRLERSLPWFDYVVHADIRNRLSAIENPVSRFSAIHDEGATSSYSNMSACYRRASECSYLSKESFDKYFLGAGSGAIGFPWQANLDYPKEASIAVTALSELKAAVELVDEENWPAAASTPTEKPSTRPLGFN
ncbi:hypothetical protein OK015_20360 [Mycobacterium sp. Aquia_216]|uniref:hypothetical protein n=1 Tax=Mycobacterium sp. Aquia_216 TaxID=2991729 RepID=UPI00227BA9AE|nr:hypothetical protein [Mycobacterium sp. Aquia_216]WAJ43538.1 hypothetical protein OK015_20360 [Mycobacterium sp. Aquia_216]